MPRFLYEGMLSDFPIEFPDECIIGEPVHLRIKMTNSRNRSDQEVIHIFVTAPKFTLDAHNKSMPYPRPGETEEVVFTLTPFRLGDGVIEIECIYFALRIHYSIIVSTIKPREGAVESVSQEENNELTASTL